MNDPKFLEPWLQY